MVSSFIIFKDSSKNTCRLGLSFFFNVYHRVFIPVSYTHLREEAEEEAIRMLNVYGEFAEKYMAVPVVKGVKSANERFAGALDTYRCV